MSYKNILCIIAKKHSFFGGLKKIDSIDYHYYYMHTKHTTHTTTMSSVEILAERVATLEKQLALLLSDKAVDVSPTKPAKETKKPKKAKEEEDKPKKKRTSGYILYSNAHRDEVKEALTEGDEKPKNTDIMKKLAENWKLLDDAGREEWNAKAKELKAEESD